MISRFVVHQHKTGKTHFDLRLIQDGILRSWSLLREPPRCSGEKRLAIEGESYSSEAIDNSMFEEESFGEGRVYTWDKGAVEVSVVSARHLILTFAGGKLSGKYEFRRMRWYPGNRWLLQMIKV